MTVSISNKWISFVLFLIAFSRILIQRNDYETLWIWSILSYSFLLSTIQGFIQLTSVDFDAGNIRWEFIGLLKKPMKWWMWMIDTIVSVWTIENKWIISIRKRIQLFWSFIKTNILLLIIREMKCRSKRRKKMLTWHHWIK